MRKSEQTPADAKSRSCGCLLGCVVGPLLFLALAFPLAFLLDYLFPDSDGEGGAFYALLGLLLFTLLGAHLGGVFGERIWDVIDKIKRRFWDS